MNATAPKHFSDRWRLARAGIVNVWHYLENEFDLSGGRMILRGTNGSGKSRALELLLPFLLDADRRKVDATGSGRVNLDELMSTGGDESTNRTGYLWLELAGPDSTLTIGALLRHSRSARRTQVWYFITPLRIGPELHLLSDTREPLTREALGELIGPENLTESAEAHRERVRTQVFGLRGDTGRDRYDGLLQLLHTLRSPDIGNRIDEGKLPRIVSDSLPPLDEQTLAKAGERLDDLTATRQAQERLETSLGHVTAFLDVYRRYAAQVVRTAADDANLAADRLDEATLAAGDRAEHHEAVRAELSAKQAQEAGLRGEVTELEVAIRAIRDRDIFKQADDLVQREQRFAAIASAADAALAEADRSRTAHARAVERADGRLAEVVATVAGTVDLLSSTRRALREAALGDGALPEDVRAEPRHHDAATVILRVRRDDEPQPVTRVAPATVEVQPSEPMAAATTVQSAVDAAGERRELASTRLVEARRLEKSERAVHALESDAANTERIADTDEAESATRADVRDALAVELAVAWRKWTATEATADLLMAPDWTTDDAVGELLRDPDSLIGSGRISLTDLDSAAIRNAQPALATVATERAGLDAAGAADAARRKDLDDEATALRRERDPEPATPLWLRAERPGVPFWRAVDFADILAPAERAGLEGALLAAGVLTATIEPDGTVRADDGTLLIGPGAVTARPLTDVLRPDSAAAISADVITAVLRSIGLDDDSATSVSFDGSWRNGPLRGRHQPTAARHIGAAARAEARRVRLTEIVTELGVLAERDRQRTARRTQLADLERSINAHVATAPRSAELFGARQVAVAAATRADSSRVRARETRQRAAESRRLWAAELDLHRRACDHFGVPAGIDALAAAVAAAAEAMRNCTQLADRLRELSARVEAHTRSLTEADDAAALRDRAEARAAERWSEWRDLAAEVAAIREAIGLDVAQARDELARSEAASRATRHLLERVGVEINTLGPAVGVAETEAEHARLEVSGRREELVGVAHRLNRRLTMPGVLQAASDTALETVARPDDASEVRACAAAVTAAIKRPAQAADDNAVLRAFQTFDRDVSGQLDALHTVDDGVSLVTVVHAGDDHTVPGAAAWLTRAVDTGRAALTQREREVFTTFVIGGVAEELRRRINQASTLIAAMNASLDSIRTSNGIGVRLGWRLVDDADLARIAALVAKSDAVRSTGDTDELTELLRSRVEHAHDGDPASGYAQHLAAALDYRAWYNVDVTILGPAPGQQRRISRQAKLSQGETRFVSYVTLFAAADGYLSGLSDDGRQLRLILLDDAFAKVDDPTIAELMGLLVHLDVDFVMTGHALWGCYPTVPKLDVYEVRRSEGTSAITTHVHWDGRNRHLRSTA